jgi:hypothetical protein
LNRIKSVGNEGGNIVSSVYIGADLHNNTVATEKYDPIQTKRKSKKQKATKEKTPNNIYTTTINFQIFHAPLCNVQSTTNETQDYPDTRED